jgi:aspartyl-tRNA(Asn)/glutamyl-tRNA(Gln) amidotransferase subunit A
VSATPTIAEAARLLRARKLSAVELTKEHLKRIASLDARLNAFLLVTEKEALAAARAADRALAGNGAARPGPLTGIPIGLKDIFETAGIRTTAHSRILEHNIPAEDAETVRRLREAGAISLGKLATHEFAIGGPATDLPWPPARNPWDTERFTGGSSSGSGAAVAAGLVLGAMGSDTGGSIRNPAAYCGIAGIKPTAGLVSRRGVIPLSQSMDTAGPMAWTAEDCAILLDVLAGHDPRDPASVAAPPPHAAKAVKDGPGKGMRIGYARRWHERDLPVAREQHAAMADAVKLLQGFGCTLHDVDPGPLIDYAAVNRLVIVAEAYAIHEHTLTHRAGDHGRAFRLRVLGGGALRAADYLAAQRHRFVLANRLNALFGQVDAILTAPVPGPARTLEIEKTDLPNSMDRPSLASPANISGGPALSVCTAFTDAGLPLGVQLIGAPFADARLLALAAAIEREAGTRARRPAL